MVPFGRWGHGKFICKIFLVNKIVSCGCHRNKLGMFVKKKKIQQNCNKSLHEIRLKPKHIHTVHFILNISQRCKNQ